jgi:hypothetical protein
MTTKIDISLLPLLLLSLDAATKEKIEVLSKRSKELGSGGEVTVNLPIKIGYVWDSGDTCEVGGWGENLKREINWDFVKSQEELIRNNINKEIKEICDFSDSVADQLGVDRVEFFNQYFV